MRHAAAHPSVLWLGTGSKGPVGFLEPGTTEAEQKASQEPAALTKEADTARALLGATTGDEI